MPQLILDEAALQLASTKLTGQPIYSGPDGNFIAPGLIDVDVIGRGDSCELWQPGNEQARCLVLGGEACRELTFQAQRFEDEIHRNRVIKSMTVPLCSLMDQVHRLTHLLNDDHSRAERSAWPRHDRENYKKIGRQFRKKRLNGPVRMVRNKLGAHLDQEIFGDLEFRFQVADFLGALGDSLILITLLINHPSAFSWIRWIDSYSSPNGDFHVVDTFFSFPICVRWATDADGKALDVGLLQLAEDPRWEIQKLTIQAMEMYNTLVDKSGLESHVSKI